MASKLCSSCLRMFQRNPQPIHIYTVSKLAASRSFNTTSRQNVELPEPNANVASSIPTVTPTRATGGPQTPSTQPMSRKAASELKKLTGKATETYTAYGATEALYKECARQADYSMPQGIDAEAETPTTKEGEELGVGTGWWHSDPRLKATFSTWSQVTMLHMYLLAARFRCFSAADSQIWQQHLLDHFFYDAENRMTINHNMHARGTRSKYLKDLFIQWRGLLAAYDEGLIKGDAVLAGAIWRNIFKADEEVDVGRLAQIVSYMRRVLKGLDSLPDSDLMEARLKFGSPASEQSVVSVKSKLMDLPFERPPGKPLPEKKKAR